MRKTLFIIFWGLPLFIGAQTNFANLGEENSWGVGFRSVSNNSNIAVSNINRL